jgi:hypothetical protein
MKPMGSKMLLRGACFAMATAAVPAVAQSPAAETPKFGEFQLGDVRISLHGALSVGTELRAANLDPLFVTIPNGAALGVRTSGNARSGDDGELNYLHRGDIVSSPVQGWLSLSATYEQYGLFVLGKGWYDYTLENSDVPWGNYPSGLQGGRPLSDQGFESRAKFGGAALQEAYVFGQNTIGGHNLYFRIGNQYIPWGLPNLFLGSLDVLNPIDYPALNRPGAIYADSLVPVPAVFLRVAATPNLSVEAFWQFASAHNAYPGCGTLFSLDYFSQGCNFVIVSAPFPLTDRQALQSGLDLTRAPTPSDNEAAQGGIGAKYTIDSINSAVGLYYAHYNSRTPITEFSRTFRASTAVPFIAGNPDGLNPVYRTVFPSGIDMVAVNWQTTLPSKTQFGAEYVFRPNQPIGLFTGDEIPAAVSATTPSLLRPSLNALLPGSFLQGWDNRMTGSLNLSVSQRFDNVNVLGAQQALIGVDIGVRSVYDLPNPNVRRYLRGDAFGPGPVNGVCAPQPPGVFTPCTLAGFVTPEAVGLRLRAQLTYVLPRIPDLALIATFVYGRDVYGWSYDGAINEGRNVALARLHLDYKARYFADFSLAGNWGGDFTPARDRSVFTLQGGVKF